MPIYIQDNEATAARRRVPMIVFADTAGTPWAGSVEGVKVRLSVNGAAETDTAADIVRVAGAAHYAQLSQTEVNVNPGDLLYLRLPAAAGRLEAFATVEIGADDPTAAGATPASVATAVSDGLADDFAALPTAAETADAVRTELATELATITGLVSATITAMRTENTTSAWGVTAQPTGGSTLTYSERRGASVIGTRTAYFDATGKPVGLTAVVPL
jgi:enoyl-CoA hydratase/carnithine racemase